jgi:hypothetical protein
MVALCSNRPKIGTRVTVKARGWFQSLIFGKDPYEGERGTVTDIKEEMTPRWASPLTSLDWGSATLPPPPLIEVQFDGGEKHLYFPDDLQQEA